jgi:hypothetical protein
MRDWRVARKPLTLFNCFGGLLLALSFLLAWKIAGAFSYARPTGPTDIAKKLRLYTCRYDMRAQKGYVRWLRRNARSRGVVLS